MPTAPTLRNHASRGSSWHWFGVVAVLTILSGCAHRPSSPVAPHRELDSFSASGTAIAPDRWWIEFGDPGLNQQVEVALGGNYTLASALQRLYAARALARREASDLFPQLNGVSFGNSTFGPGRDRTRINLGLEASYQVDLWGRIQSRADAERFRAEATHLDYHAVALTLSAAVTETWFSLIEAHAQARVLN